MEVKLLSGTQKPIDVMYAAARTCYSSKTPIELYNRYADLGEYDAISEDEDNSITEKRWKLVKGVLDSGHQSIAEHVNLTFAICGISRACSHQLVRHRLCTFSQQSQRYVEIKEDLKEIVSALYYTRKEEPDVSNSYFYIKDLVEKYFVVPDGLSVEEYCNYGDALAHYLTAIEDGAKAEDARMFLPNATKTNLVMTLNLRQLIHICQLRLCVRSQKEIRELFKLIVEEVKENYDCKIVDLLGASCDILGYCPEGDKSCGRKPILQSILNSYSK